MGLILSKKGMGDYDAVAATQIRAIVGLQPLPFVTFMKRWKRVLFTIRDKGMKATTIGAIFGPLLVLHFLFTQFSILQQVLRLH